MELCGRTGGFKSLWSLTGVSRNRLGGHFSPLRLAFNHNLELPLHRRQRRRGPNGRPFTRRERIATHENYYFKFLLAWKAQKLITVPHPSQHRHQRYISLKYPTTSLSKRRQTSHHRISRHNTKHHKSITRLGNHFHASKTKISWKHRWRSSTAAAATDNQLSNGGRSPGNGYLQRSSVNCQQQRH